MTFRGATTIQRYRLRAEPDGWTVYDLWTGRPVRLAGGPQSGLPRQVAELTADLLNWRARQGDRHVFL
jgi:hypothetical protein